MSQFRVLGESGVTQPCLIALESTLSGPIPLEKATVLTKNDDEHLFVLWESLDWPYLGVIIPSGFASGYGGEGGRGFSLALCMILDQGIPLEHVKVARDVFDEIDRGFLPMERQKAICDDGPKSDVPLGNWIFKRHVELMLTHRLWRVQSWQMWNSVMAWSQPAFDVDSFSWKVGDKLYMASKNLVDNAQPENCQQVGLMLRDAWIEFSRVARFQLEETGSKIGKDDVKRVLEGLRLPNAITAKAKQAHAGANALQHDRGATPDLARRCFDNTVEAMAEIIRTRFHGQTDPRIKRLIPRN